MDKHRFQKLAGLLKEDFNLPDESPFEEQTLEQLIKSCLKRLQDHGIDPNSTKYEANDNTNAGTYKKGMTVEEYVKEFFNQFGDSSDISVKAKDIVDITPKDKLGVYTADVAYIYLTPEDYDEDSNEMGAQFSLTDPTQEPDFYKSSQDEEKS